MQRWLVNTVPEDKQRLFDSKTVADPFCRAWVTEHPGTELILLFRKDMRPTTRYSSVNGQVVAQKLNRPTGAGQPSKRDARCGAEVIDIHLQNKLGLTARDAARAREALVEVWKEGLQAEGLVWTPAGALVVAKVRRIKRTGNSSRAELAKLLQRKIKIEFTPNPKYFPEPKKGEYTYRQFAVARQMGLIEERPPRPKPLSPQIIAMRPQSTKPKRIPPRRRREIR